MGVLDSIFGGVGVNIRGTLVSALEDAQRRLEAQVGVFLQTGQVVSDMRARAQNYRSVPDKTVSDRAASLVARSNGLLAQYAALKDQAATLAAKLVALKNDLMGDPAFTVDPKIAGTAVSERVAKKSSAIVAAGGEAITLVSRIASYMKDVKNLQTDVGNLDSYAQGEGFAHLLENAGGSLGSTVKTTAVVGVLAALTYFMLPGLLARTAKKFR